MNDVLQFGGVMAIITVSVVGITGGVAAAVRLARRGVPSIDAAELAALRDRLARLEQAVDVVAVEIERVGEAQRYTERLVAGRGPRRTRAMRSRPRRRTACRAPNTQRLAPNPQPGRPVPNTACRRS